MNHDLLIRLISYIDTCLFVACFAEVLCHFERWENSIFFMTSWTACTTGVMPNLRTFNTSLDVELLSQLVLKSGRLFLITILIWFV